MRKMSTLMALLITGYILGVFNFLLMPKYYLAFGLKGFLISLGALAVGMVLIYSELEATRKTRYLIHEFMVKVVRLPAVTIIILTFLMLLGAVNLYYSSAAILKLFNLDGLILVPTMFAIVIVIWMFLMLLRSRSVEFIGALAVMFIIFAFVAMFLMRIQVYNFVKSPNALSYLNSYRHAVFSIDHTLTARGVVLMLITVLLSLGLGAGVYYILGSFAPPDLDFRKLLGIVILLQILLSFAATFTTIYAIGAAYQSYEDNKVRYKQVHEELGKVFTNPNLTSEEAMAEYNQLHEVLQHINQTLTHFLKVQKYASFSDENPIRAIKTFYLIPDIIRESGIGGSSIIILLLLGSLFLAGFTTLIVLMEIGAQISAETFQMRRNASVSLISAVVLVLSAAMMVDGIRVMFLAALFGAGGLIMAVEGTPLLLGVSPVDRRLVGVGVALSALIGVLTLRTMLEFPCSYVPIGILLGLLLFLPLIFNGYLLAGVRRPR